jgi:hypothetical protein
VQYTLSLHDALPICTPTEIAIGAVSTGDPNTNASVVNSGTPTEAVLDFVIPRGAPGDGGTGTPTEIAIGAVSTGDPNTNASVINSGTPTNAVLDFVIPRGTPGTPGTPGLAAQISIGTVSPGAPGSNPVVTNAGNPTNAVLNFTIPSGQPGLGGQQGNQGDPGPGLDQLFLRPIELAFFSNPDNPETDNERPDQVRNLPLAIPGTIRGYPALVFSEGRGVAAFSILRPTSLPAGKPLRLLLYCTGKRGTVDWEVTWRWLRSLSPGDGLQADGELTTSGFSTTSFANSSLPIIELQQFHLHRSAPLKLAVPETVNEPDYLMVYLVPKLGDISGNLYLLMAELRWEV